MKQIHVGIDVSKAKLDIACLSDDNSSSLYRCSNTKTGIASLIKWLKSVAVAPAKTLVVVESTSHYHWLVCLLLREVNFDVRLINPIITKRQQKLSIRDAKSDRIDALRLAKIARTGTSKELPVFFDSRKALVKKRYQSLIATLETNKQSLQMAYKSALEASKKIDIEMDLSSLEDALKALQTTITLLKKIIVNKPSAFTKRLAEAPGISLFQATILTNAITGRNFTNRDQIVAFFGMDVRARQSGNWQGSSCLSKRGNAFCRKVLFQIGWSLWRHNVIFRNYFESLKARGKHFFTCILATARRFLRHFFRVYQEQKLAGSL